MIYLDYTVIIPFLLIRLAINIEIHKTLFVVSGETSFSICICKKKINNNTQVNILIILIQFIDSVRL